MSKFRPNRVPGQLHWPMDEGAGADPTGAEITNVGLRETNKVAQFLTGTQPPYMHFHGSPTWARDHFMGNYIITANNNYARIPSFHSIAEFSTGSFTVSCWIKFTSSSFAYSAFLSNTTPFDGSGHTWGWSLHVSADSGGGNLGKPYMFVGDNVSGHATNTSPNSWPALNDGKWHLVVGICDRTNQVIGCSVDGRAFVTASVSAVGSLAGSGSTLRFGQSDEGGTDGFPGGIGDIRIWTNRNITLSEVQSLYREKLFRRDSLSPRMMLLNQIAGGGPVGGGGGNNAISIIG